MNLNESTINALNFILESRDDAAINIDEILDLDNDQGTFFDFCDDFHFDQAGFDAARTLYSRIIHG